MTDVFTTEKRSWIMSRIRGKDTKPERIVRSLLHSLGYRFTVNGPKNRKLPGKPDVVLPKHQTVLFINGCLWHGHQGCRDYRLPKTRTEWWRAKIEGNRLRDGKNIALLENEGWNVVVLWNCEINTREKLAALAGKLPGLIRPPAPQTAPLRAAEDAPGYGKPGKNPR